MTWNHVQFATRGAFDAFPRSRIERAYAHYTLLCGGKPLEGRVGGPVGYFLAYRMYLGSSPTRAAIEEYLYRLSLALQSRVFGTPHLIGL